MFNWRLFFLSQVIVSLFSVVSTLEKGDFFPYGPGTEDQSLVAGDNVSSSEIKLAVPLTLFDTKYPSIWVRFRLTLLEIDFALKLFFLSFLGQQRWHSHSQSRGLRILQWTFSPSVCCEYSFPLSHFA